MKTYMIVLLHTAYWLMCLVVVSMVSLIDTHGTKIELFSPVFAGSLIPACIGFYIFYTLLFDRYLATKKIKALFSYGFLCVFVSATLTLIVLYFTYTLRMFKGVAPVLFAGTIFASISLLNGVLGLVIKGFITWYTDIKVKLELTEKNYQIELSLIRAQLNPHFLFNTINNIDGLIHDQPYKASEYLNKLSEMMRFMLYETKTQKIPLAKELAYIEKYISLQKMRTTNSDFVSFVVEGTAEQLMIEPMLFIPFIENAFKYVKDKKLTNAIRVLFKLEENRISFECINAYSDTRSFIAEYGGLGNELIQKRLSLLYKDKYQLRMNSKNGMYAVTLIISF